MTNVHQKFFNRSFHNFRIFAVVGVFFLLLSSTLLGKGIIPTGDDFLNHPYTSQNDNIISIENSSGTSTSAKFSANDETSIKRLLNAELECDNIIDEWIQLGSNIDSSNENDKQGYSISLSADGTTLAVGAPYNDGNGINSGHVKVYKRDTTSSLGWMQLGMSIEGEASYDLSGFSLDLSSDGSILAIGAPLNQVSNYGHVRIYKRDISSPIGWSQIGIDIDGESAGDGFGMSLSISANGKLVAIGSPWNEQPGMVSSGQVRVYEEDASSPEGWIQFGPDLNGKASGERVGHSVAISSNGSTIAVGAISNSGRIVRVYKKDTSTSTWKQLGDDIIAEQATGDVSVALSANGRIVAFGTKGHACVFQIGSSSSWVQIGDELSGQAPSGANGFSVALSADGSIVAVGNEKNVLIFFNVFGKWIRFGSNFSDYDGSDSVSVSTSSDGLTLSIGYPGYDGGGRVQVYKHGYCEEADDDDGKLPSPSYHPTLIPIQKPSLNPSRKPSFKPSFEPPQPSAQPSTQPSHSPNNETLPSFESQPSLSPSMSSPSYQPSNKPTVPSSESSKCIDANKKAKFFTGELKIKANGKKKPKTKTCVWLSNAGIWKINKFCSMTEGYWSKRPAREVCAGTCNRYTNAC